MELEQKSPEQPNFKMVVWLFAITVVIVLAFALLFLRTESKHIPSPAAPPAARPQSQSFPSLPASKPVNYV